jgi:hypothetical protein
MPYLVCTGAALDCSFGSEPSVFAAPGAQVMAGGNPVGVTTDDTALVNVPPFGLCSSPLNPAVAAATAEADGVLVPQPCLPVLSPWTQGSAQVMIDGASALDGSSQCRCAWAGGITVSYAGQDSVIVQ